MPDSHTTKRKTRAEAFRDAARYFRNAKIFGKLNAANVARRLDQMAETDYGL